MKWHSSVEALYALIFALCILAALLLLAGCGSKETTVTDDKPVVQGQSVVFPAKSEAVERLAVERVAEPMEREISMPGRLVWDEERTVRVFPPFGGRVTRLIAQVGDRVAAGAPLAEIMSPDFGQAQADARKAQADLSLSTQALQRQRDLNNAGVTSAKDLQQAEADYARARAESDRATGRLTAYGHSVDNAQRFVLKSPMAGTVVERNLNPGQEVRPDQPGAPLFVVTDPAHLWVTLDANESDLRYLAKGMTLVVSSNQMPDDAFAGEIRQLADFVDPTSRTVKVRGVVPNPNRTLKGEMFVSARAKIPKTEEPTVSSKAVYLWGVRNYVFVRDKGSTYTRKPVRIGSEVDGRVPVVSGVRQGDEVVVSGNLFLQQILGSARKAEGAEEKTAKVP
jgi:cobalt-zinc-cadmium efflux system membrane fusion protein